MAEITAQAGYGKYASCKHDDLLPEREGNLPDDCRMALWQLQKVALRGQGYGPVLRQTSHVKRATAQIYEPGC